MAAFVLAHLSDAHLAPLPRPRLGELVGKRVIGYINWRRKRHRIHRSDVLARIVGHLKSQVPDHIAVTGDLVNLSLEDEFPPARTFIESLGRAANVTLVPGNHDAYVRSAVSYTQAHWGDFMRGDANGALHEYKFPFVRRRGPLALIGLSSAVATAPFMATGMLGAAQLQQLADILDRLDDMFRVVLIHHPPQSIPSRRFKRLVDGADLQNVLARHGAELLIHGHDHVHSLTWLDGPNGPIPALGVPSASEAPPGEHEPAGYNIYSIEGEPGAWRCEAVSHSMSRDGNAIVEIRREQLYS
ncbi:MAG TPA: metallophosphoesterase [Xanthobacteraceae bacterium]|jgi:3',5'-cyclic AMP phosphodiesterase CpdA|nr:metallophosphoesterase [Xanthobacteraceae bacterium]